MAIDILLQEALDSHIRDDAKRWQLQADVNASMDARIIELAQQVYDGTIPQMDESNPTVIIGTGGLIDLGSSDSYTIVKNGYIRCVYQTILGAAISVLVNGVSVFDVLVGLLGTQASDFIQVSTGDVITSIGTLSLGGGLNVTFYPNKELGAG